MKQIYFPRHVSQPVMHNEQYECTSLLRIGIQKNVISTYYLNIHFSLCTSQQTNTKQLLSIETFKHYILIPVRTYLAHTCKK